MYVFNVFLKQYVCVSDCLSLRYEVYAHVPQVCGEMIDEHGEEEIYGAYAKGEDIKSTLCTASCRGHKEL